ncbi:MAG: response regulator transcription factor [Cyanobacteria bacterium RM1_2_2]|nr:response regulator transcription factor [Cyanobacteria bacterium RM1_2_2]
MSQILIVEDEPRIVSFLEKGLRKHGYETAVAMDGEEALRMIQKGIFDLLLLDLGLPLKDGWTVLRELRQTQDKIPEVIILTARADDHDHVQGIQLGVRDYITKPFRFNDLLGRVEAILQAQNSLHA